MTPLLDIDLGYWSKTIDTWTGVDWESMFDEGNTTHIETPFGRFERREVSWNMNVLYVPEHDEHVHVEQCKFIHDDDWANEKRRSLEEAIRNQKTVEVPIHTMDIRLHAGHDGLKGVDGGP